MYTHTWYLCESTQQLKKEKQNERKNKPMISQSVPNLHSDITTFLSSLLFFKKKKTQSGRLDNASKEGETTLVMCSKPPQSCTQFMIRMQQHLTKKKKKDDN